MSSSKSKQILEYLYKFAIEKGTTEIIEAVVPYGKIGITLWEAANGIYDILYSASDEDRSVILSEIQGLSEYEIEQRLNQLAEDTKILNPMNISIDDRKQVVRGIYQTLKKIPNQRVNPNQVIHTINQTLFKGNPVLSQQNVHIGSESMGSAVVKSLLHGKNVNQIHQKMNQPPPQIDGFEIKGILGAGAYATVYIAVDQKQKTICALKVGQLANNKSVEQEFNHMKAIQHKNVLNCWDMGVFEKDYQQYYWISMPNIGGLTLDRLMADSLDLETKLLILMQILDGLEALHSKGIIHMDLKPGNCLISKDFEIKIGDFGLSQDASKDIKSTENLHYKITDAIGTPAYMSPEQVDGKNIGFYSDVWSFGIIAYELFKGDLPWEKNINAYVRLGKIQHVDIDINDLKNTGISSNMLNIVGKCLKRDYQQRYQSAIELKKDIYPLLNEDRNRLRHNRFSKSWHSLIEHNLIENFIVDQVQQEVSEFKIDEFLTQPKIHELSLIVDRERLEQVLTQISKAALDIGLFEIIDRKKQIETLKTQLKTRKDSAIAQIEKETAEELLKMPQHELARKLEEISEKQKQKKLPIEHDFQGSFNKLSTYLEENHAQLKKLMIELKNQLRAELKHELMSFDQMKKDQKIKEESEKIANRKRSKRILISIFAFSLMLGGYVYFDDIKNQVGDYMAVRDMAVRDMAVRDMAVRDMAVRDMAVRDMAVRDMAVRDMVVPDMFVESDIEKMRRLGIYLVSIKGGFFIMGNHEIEEESPEHRVTVNDFYMSQTEITVAQYKACVDVGVCSVPNSNSANHCNWGYRDRENHPINCVDWEQARTFAKWVGGDLPSEAQWEYASKSEGLNIKYPWTNRSNDEVTCDIANFTYDCHYQTAPVCSKNKGNTSQGLCDMIGNVWEWVLDEYHPSYQNAPNVDNAWCSDSECSYQVKRVYRGGSWHNQKSNHTMTTTSRSAVYPKEFYDDLGFRIVKSIR